MKKILLAIALLLTLTPSVSYADVSTNNNIVIIDDGYDPSITQFAGKIVYEVCFSQLIQSCPNKGFFQEGQGAAALTTTQSKFIEGNHGSDMLATAIAENSNAKFVVIRSAAYTNFGVLLPSDPDISNVLNWVYANKDKLHIGAIVSSTGRNITSACPQNSSISNVVNSFKAIGVPVIYAVGNNYDYKNIAFPSCMPGIIAIGAVDRYGIPALYSNWSPSVAFLALGDITVNSVGNKQTRIMGTSPSAQIFAADWVAIKTAKPFLTYDQEYALIQKTASFTSNQYVKNQASINLANALKP